MPEKKDPSNALVPVSARRGNSNHPLRERSARLGSERRRRRGWNCGHKRCERHGCRRCNWFHDHRHEHSAEQLDPERDRAYAGADTGTILRHSVHKPADDRSARWNSQSKPAHDTTDRPVHIADQPAGRRPGHDRIRWRSPKPELGAGWGAG